MTESPPTPTSPSPSRPSRSTPARERLIETATRMFNAGGYHATGIDQILAGAGVAKMTLYNNFASKEDLIVEVLRRRGEGFRAWLAEWVARSGAATPRERLLAVFDALAVWHRDGPDGPGLPFKGCVFVRASGEYPSGDSAIHLAAAANKQAVIDLLAELASDLTVPDPRDLAEQLGYLIEGATVAALTRGRTDAAERAKRSAAILIDASVSNPA
ncbi:MAG: TetR/AcrR family transcriptional regulator [Alphaproteobacteria bacterium]|nr:TetR/AcrR family transcriptional regulator [Alphaproteobacteria bacterium]